MIAQMLEARNRRKLGEAIANHNYKAMQHFLAKGTKQVDYLTMRPADFEDGRARVPDQKFHDPVLLAQKVALPQQGWDLLRQYGLDRSPQPQVTPQPTR